MEQEILFSVIIPHYNTPAYLLRLLESISFFKEEMQVIVVDDNSNAQLKMLNECRHIYSEKGVEFYDNCGKKGAGTCRNIGLQHAKGRWILFADADDIFLPGYMQIISQYRDSRADIIFFDPISREEDTGKESVRHVALSRYIHNYFYSAGKKREDIELRYHHAVPWSKMIRHSVIKKNHIWFDEVMHSNDTMFSMKVAFYSRKIDASLQKIYCCMRNDFSLTSDSSADVYKLRYKIWINKYKFLKEHLSQKDFEILNLSAANYIFIGIHNKVGAGTVLYALREACRNHVRLIPRHLLNPRFIKDHILTSICDMRGSKKYFHK